MPMNDAKNWEGWEKVEDDDGWEKVEDLSPQPVLPVAEKYVGPAREFGKRALGAIGTASEFIDRYTGAPVRAAVGAAIDQKPGDKPFWEAGFSQFGEPTEKAPSGKDIASKLGVPTKEFSTGLVLDPFKVETLKASPAGIAGAVGETVMDPTTALSAAGITPFKIAEKTAKGLGAATKWGVKKAARGLFDIPEQATEDLIQRSARVKEVGKSLPSEEIGVRMDEAVKAAGSDIAATTDRRKRLEEYLKTIYQDKRRGLEREQVPLDVVRQAKGNIEQQKATIGRLSDEADQALIDSGVTFRKSDLIKTIQEAKDSVIDIPVGKETKAALNDINAIIQDINDNVADQISARQLRSILKNLRRDTNFDYSAGAYNETADIIRKDFGRKISDALKGKITETGQRNPHLERYSEIMDEMSPMQDSLKEASKLFGGTDEARGIGTLETMRKGGGSKGAMIDEQLRKNAAIGNNQQLIDLLDRYKSNSQLLQRMKDKDISSEIFPNEYKALQEAIADEQMANEVLGPTQNISPRRTQSVIRRQGQKTAPWTDKNDIKLLSDYSGEDFNELIKSRNTYDEFDKYAGRGTRLTFLGGLAGSYLGDSSGAFIGGGIGSMADRFGPPMTRAAISGAMTGKGAVEKIFRMATDNPLFKSKYSKLFGQAIDRGGYPAVNLYHNLLMNNDPEYRKLFEGEQ